MPTPEEIAAYKKSWAEDSGGAQPTQGEIDAHFFAAGPGGGTTTPIEAWKAETAQQLDKTVGPYVSGYVMKLLAPQIAMYSGLKDAEQQGYLPYLTTQATNQLEPAQGLAKQDRDREFNTWFDRTFLAPNLNAVGPLASAQNAVTRSALAGLRGAYLDRFDKYFDDPTNHLVGQSPTAVLSNFLGASGDAIMGEARPDQSPSDPTRQDGEAVIRQNVNQTVTLLQAQSRQEAQIMAAKARGVAHISSLLGALSRDPDATDGQRALLNAAFDQLSDTTGLVQAYWASGGVLPSDQFVNGYVGANVQNALSGTKYAGAVTIDAQGGVDLGATSSAVTLADKAEKVAATATKNQQDWQATVDSAVAQGQIKPGDADGVLKKAGVDASGQPNYTAARTALAGTIKVNADTAKDTSDQGNLDGTLATFKAQHPSVNVSAIDTKKLLADAGGDPAVATKNLTAALDTAGKAQANTQTFGLGQPGVAAVPATPGTGNYDPTRRPGAESVADVQMGKYAKSPTGPGSYSHSYDLTRLSAPTQAALAAGQALTIEQAHEVAQANRGFRNIYSGAATDGNDPAGFNTKADMGKNVVAGLWQQANGDAATFHNLLTTHISTGENQAKTEQLDRSTLPGFKTTAEAMSTGPLWTGTIKGPEPAKQTATIV